MFKNTIGTAVLMAILFPLGAFNSFAQCKDGQTSEVVAYELSKGDTLDKQIKESLTGKKGDPEAGVKWIVHRRLGNCIACHQSKTLLKRVKEGDVATQSKYGFHGEIGPPLDGVGDRYTEGEIRLIVVDSKLAFPDLDTAMPAFMKTDGLHRVIKECKGKTMMTPQQIEDVVAFLVTQKE